MRLLTFLFILTISFSFQSSENFKKRDLHGYWSWKMGQQYYPKEKFKRKDGLGFTFKRSGKLKVRMCTDICGCMARTFQGEWKWLGDNQVEIKWSARERILKIKKVEDGFILTSI